MRKRWMIPALVLAATLAGCQKEKTDGELLVEVSYQNSPAGNATVYLYTDTLLPPVQQERTDVAGEAYFTKLSPQHYYVLAKEHTGSGIRSAWKEITVYPRTGNNFYTLSMILE